MADVDAVCKKMDELSIERSLHSHDAVMTAEEQAKVVGHLPGILTKNLFLADKKNGLFLVTLKHDRQVPNVGKTVAKLLKLTGANLRFGKEEVLLEKLGVRQGSVTPLAVMNDTEGGVRLVIDKALMDADVINCHPLQNDKTVSIKPKDLETWVSHFNHKLEIVDFDNIPADAAPKKSEKAPKQPSSGKANKTKVKESKKQSNDDYGRGQKVVKKETMIGVDASKEEEFSDWYQQVILRAELVDYYDVSGCYILRPWAYTMWEFVQQFLDAKIKSIGVRNCYFPMFVSERALNAEKEHVEGFAPEVAWVTKSGNSDMKEPVAIRPTSETIMYPAFANWIRSHRDLPLLLNQWCNIVRWEFKNPTPFLRTREFLWQEGHTAHATKEEADAEVLTILGFYASVYEDLMAIPVIKGIKTEKEKFAGGDYTTTVEAFIPTTGRGIQGATSHMLGQNFGKMFKIEFEDETGGHSIPWQNSWGLTTRTLGVMIMVHGDDRGLVIPPKLAPVQAVVIPILYEDAGRSELIKRAKEVYDLLKAAGIRTHLDDRVNYTPGWKYNDWEMKGVPLRFEIGPKDLVKNQVRIVRRDDGSKEDVPMSFLLEKTKLLIAQIQHDMFVKAKKNRDDRVRKITTWEEFLPALNDKCMVLAPFCNETEFEELVKKRSKEEALALIGEDEEDEKSATSASAKTLCIPFDQPELPEGTKCFISGKPATCWTLFGRSY